MLGDCSKFSLPMSNSRRGHNVIMVTPILFAEAVETIPADEATDIERIIEIQRQLMRRDLETSGHYRRDVHVKAHGCARAEFRIPADLPGELSQGLFAHPGVYSSFVRFSNSAPWPQPDAVPDGRGLAIQVENVPGNRISSASSLATTQDFVMVNCSTFIARDVKDYLGLEEARLQAGERPVRLAASLASRVWNPFQWRVREALAVASVAAQPPSHPASYTYFSMVPIRYGQYVAKYRVVPGTMRPMISPWMRVSFALRRDPMRRVLEETLAQQELTFEFQVQLRTSESMPVEDATVEWPERESPYQTVAFLVLPRQDLALSQAREDGDRRSFSVWNSLVDHCPLGGINRSRRAAYAASAAWRSQRKGDF